MSEIPKSALRLPLPDRAEFRRMQYEGRQDDDCRRSTADHYRAGQAPDKALSPGQMKPPQPVATDVELFR